MRFVRALVLGSHVLVLALRPAARGAPAAVRRGAADASDDGEAGAAAKARVLFCLGGPGAGKGTQCARLAAEYGVVHLSAGDLLREERAAGSADGALIERYIAEGRIVPVRVTLGLLRKAMARAPGALFVIDGFPRNADNLEGWDAHMADAADVAGVLFYDCSHAVMQERVLKRGAEGSGRSDDNAAAALKRVRIYEDATRPIIDHYRQLGKLLAVPGEGDVEDVWARTKAAVEPLLP